ncbi:acetate/propionate family kinase [Marinomonas algicola]|uniref:acetate/propionate family kinase n=1 Tax=Marinomonas algicola TaxID=2773454 RepID=UPI00174A71F3|nr:acetate kinase [Marinomonas algicola]
MDDTILVINSGSSSLKFAILSNDGDLILVEGIAEGLGSNQGRLTIKFDGQKHFHALPTSNHKSALIQISNWLDINESIKADLKGIGHRIVHGGESFSASVLINDDVLTALNKCSELAPLHSPAHLKGIEIAKSLFPTLPQVAVFDTAFHQTLSPEQFLYGIPAKYYQEYHFRKYGFHGTSYRYVSAKLGTINPQSLKQGVLVAHLGNGASVCAINSAKSTDTSMGLTPLDGLIMGTRSGSVDPSLLAFIAEKEQTSISDTIDILNKKSGLLGISELSNDCRKLEEAMLAGNEKAKLALDMFASRAAKQLMSAATTLDSIDHIVFTGGIGENSSYIRRKVCDNLKAFNIKINAIKNTDMARSEICLISDENSSAHIWVIPTNEEKMIAIDTINLIKNEPVN